jgi:hypothetical protein
VQVYPHLELSCSYCQTDCHKGGLHQNNNNCQSSLVGSNRGAKKVSAGLAHSSNLQHNGESCFCGKLIIFLREFTWFGISQAGFILCGICQGVHLASNFSGSSFGLIFLKKDIWLGISKGVYLAWYFSRNSLGLFLREFLKWPISSQFQHDVLSHLTPPYLPFKMFYFMFTWFKSHQQLIPKRLMSLLDPPCSDQLSYAQAVLIQKVKKHWSLGTILCWPMLT